MSLQRKPDGKLYTDTGVYIGDVLSMDDGYYYFWPRRDNGGCFSEGNLMEITTLLRTMNAAWDVQVQTDPSIGRPPPSEERCPICEYKYSAHIGVLNICPTSDIPEKKDGRPRAPEESEAQSQRPQSLREGAAASPDPDQGQEHAAAQEGGLGESEAQPGKALRDAGGRVAEDNVTFAWFAGSGAFTVEQALQDALNMQHREEYHPLTSVLIVGEFENGELFVRSSRMTRIEAHWLAERAKHHAFKLQIAVDDD